MRISDHYLTGYTPDADDIKRAGSIGYANQLGQSRLAGLEKWLELNLTPWLAAPIIYALNDCRRDQGIWSPNAIRRRQMNSWMISRRSGSDKGYSS